MHTLARKKRIQTLLFQILILLLAAAFLFPIA